MESDESDLHMLLLLLHSLAKDFGTRVVCRPIRICSSSFVEIDLNWDNWERSNEARSVQSNSIQFNPIPSTLWSNFHGLS